MCTTPSAHTKSTALVAHPLTKSRSFPLDPNTPPFFAPRRPPPKPPHAPLLAPLPSYLSTNTSPPSNVLSLFATCVLICAAVSLAGTKWYSSVSCNPGLPGFAARSAGVSMKNPGSVARYLINAALVGAKTVSGFVGLALATARNNPPPVRACSKTLSSNRSTRTCATVRRVGSGCGAGGTRTQSMTWTTPLLACAFARRTSHPSTKKARWNTPEKTSTSRPSVRAAYASAGAAPADTASRIARATLGAVACMVGIFWPKNIPCVYTSDRLAW